jgi:nitrate reductase NapD
MNICSVIVLARPERIAEVQQQLEALPGVEVQGKDESGKLIVTVEDAEKVEAADTMMSFNSLEGVISSTLIYHYGGDDLDEEVIREAN